MKKTQIAFFYALIAVSLGLDCKTSKNHNSDSGKTLNHSSAASDKKINDAPQKPADTPHEKSTALTGDTLFASIQRTPCYGKCPIYSIKVYKSGYVVYKGIRFVEKTGVYSSRISIRQMQQIIDKAMLTGYFDLENEYDSPVTDLPTTITTLNAEGRSKTIEDRVGGPVQLKEYEKFFDGIFDGLEWIKLSDSSQE